MAAVSVAVAVAEKVSRSSATKWDIIQCAILSNLILITIDNLEIFKNKLIVFV